MKTSARERTISTLLILAAVLICTNFSLFAADEWPGVKYAEVRAYAWPTTHSDDDGVISAELRPKDGVLNKDGAVLTAEQVKRLLAAVTGTHAKHPVAECYEPRNAFVFYDADKKPVAFVEVCFECLSKRIQPKGAASPVDMVELAKIFGELKLPMGKYPDAESFEKNFKALNAPKPPKEKPPEPEQDSKQSGTPAK